MNLQSLSDNKLVYEYAKAKEDEAAAKKHSEEIAAEIQRRTVGEIDEGLTNFKRLAGDRGAVTVYKKGSFKMISPLGLKKLIGTDLFNSEFKKEKIEVYKPDSEFEEVLKAISLGDYDFSVGMDAVYDALGADEKQRKVLDKKLKGAPEKDYRVLISTLGDGDYDTEVFMISKIKSAEKIKVFFPESNEAFLERMRKYFYVAESLGISFAKEV